jgi:hypothetical protein
MKVSTAAFGVEKSPFAFAAPEVFEAGVALVVEPVFELLTLVELPVLLEPLLLSELQPVSSSKARPQVTIKLRIFDLLLWGLSVKEP